jgi:hypothetical protein
MVSKSPFSSFTSNFYEVREKIPVEEKHDRKLPEYANWLIVALVYFEGLGAQGEASQGPTIIDAVGQPVLPCIWRSLQLE